MSFDPEKMGELLDHASMDLVMIASDNLLELSSLLGLMAGLAEAFEPLDSKDPLRVIKASEDVLRAAIQDRIPDRDKAVAMVGDGLSLLQEMARAIPAKSPLNGDLEGFVKKALALSSLLPQSKELGPDSKTLESDLADSSSGEKTLERLALENCGKPEVGSEEAKPILGTDIIPSPGGQNTQQRFQPRKKGQGLAFIVPTPTQVRRDAFLSSQKLTVDYFKADFVGAIEQLQMQLVTVEQKVDTVTAMAETIPQFRSILGGFSLLDLDGLAWLTADIIGLIDYVSTDQVPHTPAVTDVLLKACSYLISGLNSLAVNEGGRTWDIHPPDWTMEDLAVLRENLWAARQGFLDVAPVELKRKSGASHIAKPKRLGEILVEKGLITEGDLGGLIQAQKNARQVRLGEIFIQLKLISEEDLAEALNRQENQDKGRKLGEILVMMGRLDHEHVDKALKIQENQKETKLGEILLKQKIGAPDKVAAALREQKQSEGPAQSASHTVKVETQKLDGLIDLVGELVITQSLVSSNDSIKVLKEQKIVKDLAQVSRITSELQRNAMSLRMVQIGQTFRKMNRLVRDLAHKFEKDVEFVTQGDDTEIDRNMVESIYDPLVHMIRNSLDHGLEAPKERLLAGKSPKGYLTLKAYHQGGNVVVELSDDGKGLDTEKVLQKAIEKGLVSPGENLSIAAIHNLVFHPGFSTAAAITEISGRGVGMDVVKKSIEQLRGKVDFKSVMGSGSTLTIRLPLTLAIIDGMIVRVGENRYILPTISINESFRPKPEEYFTVKNQGEMIKVRDQFLPLVRLDRIVDAGGGTLDPSKALVVVVENEGQRRCLMVDEVLGKQEVVIKSLGERLKYVRTLAGGTILGDGRVGLILDINGLFEAEESGGTIGPLSGPDPGDWDMEV